MKQWLLIELFFKTLCYRHGIVFCWHNLPPSNALPATLDDWGRDDVKWVGFGREWWMTIWEWGSCWGLGFHLLIFISSTNFFSSPLGCGKVFENWITSILYIYLIPVCSLEREGVRPVSDFVLFRVNLLAVTTNFNASNSPHGGLIVKVYGTPPQNQKLFELFLSWVTVGFALVSGSLPHQCPFFSFFSSFFYLFTHLFLYYIPKKPWTAVPDRDIPDILTDEQRGQGNILYTIHVGYAGHVIY